MLDKFYMKTVLKDCLHISFISLLYMQLIRFVYKL